ncbi:hypothetical protein DEO72_LG7g1226 [Vigna unguiculata]|uniref:Uncharacterized protein n=1 Tax=Vigna unguiculata TaxID=3917 RepID=A0A4D6MES5_VIGUN|nr:hypothetical protein DEO72_LG7g1226 [Vigna unguiculata]
MPSIAAETLATVNEPAQQQSAAVRPPFSPEATASSTFAASTIVILARNHPDQHQHGNNSTPFLQSPKQHHLRAPNRRRRITHPSLHAFFIFTKLEQPLRSRCSSATPPQFLHLHHELTIAASLENANQRSFLAHHHGHRRPATNNSSLTGEEEAVAPEVIMPGTSDAQHSTTLTH